MRPLKLVAEGFGTYLKKTEIDFTKFGNEGLYLITGDTGSGKTTIFDAITYALYGVASGENRDENMLRTKGAEDDVPTYVELTFENRGKEYTIFRCPQGLCNPSKTKIGSAKPTLYSSDVKVIDGRTSVTNRVKEILGIDAKQFKQIAMISQGDFQKLLTADSKTRQSLFSSLFKTNKYALLESRVKNDRDQLDNALSSTRAVLNNQAALITSDSTKPSAIKVSNLNSPSISWEDKLGIIEEVISEDEKDAKKLTKSRAEYQKKNEEILLKLEKINNLKNDEKLLEEQKVLKERKESLLESQKETLEVLKEAFDGTTALSNEKAILKEELVKYEEVDLKAKEISDSKSRNEALTQKIEKLTSDIEKENEEISNIKKQLDALKDVAVNHQKYTNDIEKGDTKLSELNLLQKKNEELSNLTLQYEKALNEYKNVRDLADKATSLYLSKNKAYLDGQAGILASSLKENTPCPVCGSLTHPHPCAICEEVPTENELNELKASSDKKENDAKEKSANCAKLKGNTETKKEELLSSAKHLFNEVKEEEIESLIKKSIEEVSISLKETKEKLLEEEKKTKMKEELEKNLPLVESKCEELKNEKVACEGERIQVITKGEENEKQLNQMKASLKFESKKEAENKIRELEQKIDQITRRYNDGKNNVDKTSNELSQIKGTIKEIENRVKSSTVDTSDEEKIVKENLECQTMINSIEEDMNKINARMSANSKALENMKQNLKGFIEDEKRLTMLTDLERTVSGGPIPGRERIKLETYAQIAYFDMVLYYANQRLDIMSEHQYELVRKDVPADGRAQFGLDLDVIDHFAGTQRDVKTLSGGESFQASLSLALGLSDEVSSAAGGIKLDTMFIDEGFGTLDNETMQKAYKALNTLASANKLVGIISHVDYLRENIDKQIIVSKTRNAGSSVTIKA